MNLPVKPKIRCAVYTRKSHEEGLEQEFNSLDAQREAAEAYITAQRHEGWMLYPDRYDDGGFTGGKLLQTLYALSRAAKYVSIITGNNNGNSECRVLSAFQLDNNHNMSQIASFLAQSRNFS